MKMNSVPSRKEVMRQAEHRNPLANRMNVDPKNPNPHVRVKRKRDVAQPKNSE